MTKQNQIIKLLEKHKYLTNQEIYNKISGTYPVIRLVRKGLIKSTIHKGKLVYFLTESDLPEHLQEKEIIIPDKPEVKIYPVKYPGVKDYKSKWEEFREELTITESDIQKVIRMSKRGVQLIEHEKEYGSRSTLKKSLTKECFLLESRFKHINNGYKGRKGTFSKPFRGGYVNHIFDSIIENMGEFLEKV
ncbi:hypothetical protein GF327_06630 [Candidatus Woesearchaeota archaeon]|nr:hypothetical protein [Candidatus Woesearchaeota archaeon]